MSVWLYSCERHLDYTITVQQEKICKALLNILSLYTATKMKIAVCMYKSGPKYMYT